MSSPGRRCHPAALPERPSVANHGAPTRRSVRCLQGRSASNAANMHDVEPPIQSRVEDGDDLPADLGWGAFTTEGPWTLQRSAIRWLPLAERLRTAARAEVPNLT